MVGRTVLERRRDDAEEGAHGRADRGGVTAWRSGPEGSRYLPEGGISEATYYAWKKQYAGLGVIELRELRQLREENGRMKRLAANLSLDKQILQKIVSKKLTANGGTSICPAKRRQQQWEQSRHDGVPKLP